MKRGIGVNLGTVFKTDGSGDNYDARPAFFKLNAATPVYTNLIQASNGKLYGMTFLGGAAGFNGVLFEYDPLTTTYSQSLYLPFIPNRLMRFSA